jgi:hypothetical protein
MRSRTLMERKVELLSYRSINVYWGAHRTFGQLLDDAHSLQNPEKN